MPIVFESRVFSVETGTRLFPNGRRHDVAIVRHRPSVVLIPFTDDGRVILVRQYRAPLDRYTWELPAGSIDPGESPEAGAARECEEETGLVPGRIDRLGSWFPTPGYCDEQMFFFTVSALRPRAPDSPHQPDEDEDIETQAMTIAGAFSMVARGEIVDLKTAYGLTLLQR
jgi:ADP-ribose pyrophosphatase